MDATRDGELVLWKYEKLCVLGIMGYLAAPLYKISEMYGDDSVEFGPVQRRPGRDFLAGFGVRPMVDVMIVKKPENNASVAVCGLDEKGLARFVQRLVETSGLVPDEPDAEFVGMTSALACLYAADYERCKCMASSLGIGEEDGFGVIRYSAFLKEHKGIHEPQNLRMAATRFGVQPEKLGVYQLPY